MAFHSILVRSWSLQVSDCSRYRSDDVEYIHSKKAFFCYVSNGQGECSIVTVFLRRLFIIN